MSMKRLLALTSVLFSLTATATLPCEPMQLALWITPQTHEEPLLQAIDHALHSVQVITYTMTDRKIIAALIQAKQRGDTVQVLIDKAPYQAANTNQSATKTLESAGVEVKTAPARFTNLHQKTLIIDQKLAFLMTGNFTYSSFYTQRNVYVALTTPALVTQIESVFQADWSNQWTHLSRSPLVWSPENHGRDIIQLINHSEKTLEIYAPGFGDPAFINAVKAAAKRGVQVTMITRPQKSRGYRQMIRALKNDNIQIKAMRPLTLHAKMVLSDDRIAYLGSNNFTSTSFHHNRELGILLCNRKNLQTLSTQFKNDQS